MAFHRNFNDANTKIRVCGFSELNMTSREEDYDSFFEIIKNEFDSKRSIKSIRKALCDLQKKEDIAFIFRAFQPANSDSMLHKLCDAFAISNEDLKISESRKSYPRPRDIYAAATLLYKTINLFIYKDEHLPIEKHEYHPFYDVGTTATALDILAIPKGKVYLYIKLNISDPKKVKTFEQQHSTCYGKRFLKRIDKAIEKEEKHETHEACSQVSRVPGNSVVASFDGNSALFRCLGKAIYNKDSFFPFIERLVIEYERRSEQQQVFMNLINADSESPKRNEEILKTHLDSIGNGTKAPGEGEMYAIATILCVKIFVYETGSLEWKMYTPLSVPSTDLLRKSYIKLQKSDIDGNVRFHLLASNSCSCETEEPRVWGDLAKIQKCLNEMKADILAKRRPCCSRSHQHLPPTTENIYLEITDGSSEDEQDEEFLEEASNQISAEGRKIEESKSAHSLEYWVSKELQ